MFEAFCILYNFTYFHAISHQIGVVNGVVALKNGVVEKSLDI